MRLEIVFDGSFDKIDKYAKMYSLHYIDYDEYVEDILNCFTNDYDLYKFHLNLFNAYKGYISVIDNTVSSIYEGVHKVKKIKSDIINVSPNVLAMCLPLHIRKRFFDYDKSLGRFFCKCDLVYHLYN